MNKLHILIIDDHHFDDKFLQKINRGRFKDHPYFTFEIFEHRKTVPKNHPCDIVVLDYGEMLDYKECTKWFKDNFSKKHLFFSSALGPQCYEHHKMTDYLKSIPWVDRDIEDMFRGIERCLITNNVEREVFEKHGYYLMHYKDKRVKFIKGDKCICGHEYESFEDKYRHNRHCSIRKKENE